MQVVLVAWCTPQHHTRSRRLFAELSLLCVRCHRAERRYQKIICSSLSTEFSLSLSSCCRIIIRREISPKKHFQSGEVWCCCITSSQPVVRTTSNFHTEIIMQKILPPPRKKTLYRNIKFPLSTNLASLVVGRFIHGGNFKMIQWGEVNNQSTYSAVVHFRSIFFYCCAAIPKQFSLWLH